MPTLSTYVSQEDYSRANQIAIEQNMSVSAMLKMAFNNATIEDKTVELRLIGEVKKIGINLNQIAHRCNIQKSVDRVTLELLSQINKNIESLL